MTDMNFESSRLFRVPDITVAESRLLKRNRKWFLVEGVALIVLGVMAMSLSVFTTIVSMAFLGWILLVGGIVHVFQAFSKPKWSTVAVSVLAGILYAVAGIFILRSPGASAITMTFLLAPLFIVVGAMRVIGSLATRFPQWGWACFSGILGIAVGLMIWNQWPTSGLWVIGTLVGLEIMFAGIAVLTFAVALQSLSDEVSIERMAA